MKTVIFAALAAAAVSAPAFAQDAAPFTGPRAGVTLGYDKFDGNDGFAYGASTGYDIAITPNVTFGSEVAFSDSTTSLGAGVEVSRDLSASVRLGYILNPKVLAFGKVGYANTRVEASNSNSGGSFEGVRYGGGLEFAVTGNTYISAEYQRSEYEDGIGGRDAGVVGIGFRF
ncbi:membrane protein [Sphingobium indicum IP26]|uniref:Membrane protein n=1 Tax=Sphingobium indicum F2 TaxID=1450518 RepID=A0A8E1C1P1_9SPHN|nr:MULTISPECIES: porin family protein [Sphingobium]EPR16106.1 membrane protein [Sphingobium indicum IP26]EQB05866.1 membrane protein [Sphingobium sp. HDIP04]KER35153.1 membrane protein [Sphingobium indicum F2]